MPAPDPHRPGPRLTRRAALVSVALVGLAGCTPPERGLDRRRREDEPVPDGPQVDPDVAVAAEVLAAATAVLALVRATADRHPALAGRLGPVAVAHEAHTALLDDAVPGEATASPSPAPSGGDAAGSPTASPTGVGTGRTGDTGPTGGAGRTGQGTRPEGEAGVGTDGRDPAVPRSPRRALEQVVTAERDLATRTKQLAFKAQSGAFARVLGSVAASAAQHAALLGATGEAGAP